MGKSRDRANRSGSDPVNIGTTRLSVDSGNVKVTAQDGATFKKIFAEEVRVGSGNNQVIFKRGSDGKAEFQSTSDGGGSTSSLQVGGSTTVTNPSDLPISGNSAGDTVLVTSTNNLMIYNGSGWYKIATITNANPTISSAGNAYYSFATNGTPVTIEIVASDPEGIALQYKYQVTTGSLGSTATVTNSATSGGTYSALAANTLSNNRFFKVTPSTNDSHAGTFAITFSVTDGVNTANSSASTFSLQFDVSGSYKFDGNDYILSPVSSNFTLGTNDFTIEYWVWNTNFSANQTISDRTNSHSGDLILQTDTSGQHKIYANSAFRITSSATSAKTWNHVAIQRASNVTKMYVNGVEQSTSYSDSNNYTGNKVTLGYLATLNGEGINGYISNYREVIGSTVYTPSTTGAGLDFGSSNSTITSLASHSGFDFGTNNLTIEFFYKWSTNSGYQTVLNHQYNAADAVTIQSDTGTRKWGFFGSSLPYVYESSNAPQDVWLHYAFVRNGNTIKIYRDGVETYSQSHTGTIGGTDTTQFGHGNTHYDKGKISNFRVVKGTALYTSAFTPPSAPLTAISGTSLLLFQENSGSTLSDGSTNNVTVTKGSGHTILTNDGPTYGSITVPTAPLTAVTNTKLLTLTESEQNSLTNGAYHFNDRNTKLRVDSSDFNLTSSTAFTIETWYKKISSSTSRALWDFGNGNLFQFYVSNTMQVYGLGGGYVIDFGSGVGYDTNKWYHVAITGDGSNNVKAYLDGVQVGSTYNASWTLSGSKILLNGNLAVSQPDDRGIEIHFADFRVVNGTQVYTGNFTRPSGPLTTTGGTYPSNTNVNTSITASHTLLLTCQNSSGSTVDNSTHGRTLNISGTITPIAGVQGAPVDQSSSTHSLSLNNDATHSYASPFAQGVGGSVLFDGSGDWLKVPSTSDFSFGTGDFTIECWFYRIGTGGIFQLSSNANGYSTSTTNSLAIGVSSATEQYMRVYSVAGGNDLLSGTSPTANAWNHVAMVRNSSDNTLKIYLNGSLVHTVSSETTNYTFTHLAVGIFYSTTYPFNGYISNFRVLKGTALYTSNFTVTSSKLTAITNTKLLTCNDSNTIDDASSSSHNIIVTGDSVATRFNPF